MTTGLRTRSSTITAAREAGAALVVGLVLLLIVTVLGVSGMNTATMEVAMSGNAQFRDDAFEMAEDGIDLALAIPAVAAEIPRTIPWLSGDPEANRRAVVTYAGATPVPDAAFSMGTAFQAYHFDVVSAGRGARNAASTHRQGFYVVGPVEP